MDPLGVVRGGLNDMMVAIVPDDDTAQLTPEGITWTEDADDDFSATTVTVTINGAPADVQATRFVYGADVVGESDHAAVVSKATNLVSRIEYPDPDNDGQPSDTDALSFTYTIGGHVASRTDQRGVTLDFHYGECPGCDETDVIPHDALSKVGVTYPTPMPADGALDDSVDYLAFERNPRGQLSAARTYDSPTAGDPISEILYAYDALGNLTSETLDPSVGSATSRAKTVAYDWDWHTPAPPVPPENPIRG